MNEIWKKSRRFPSYEISDSGYIRRNGKIRKSGINSSGYLQIPIWQNGKQYMVYPHHLVAEEFIGERPQGHDVNHIDRDKMNNSASNLEYLTHKQNCPRGSMSPRAKFKENDIKTIREMRKNGYSQQYISDVFHVVQTTISRILLKQTWAHVL